MMKCGSWYLAAALVVATWMGAERAGAQDSAAQAPDAEPAPETPAAPATAPAPGAPASLPSGAATEPDPTSPDAPDAPAQAPDTGAAATAAPPAPPASPDPEPEPAPAPSASLELAPDLASAPDAEPEDPEEPEVIVVTGSRVKRTTFSQPSAVQVVSRAELEMSGADNMADVIRNMSINYGSELNTDVSTAAGGTSQFNLRGLGLNSTLVLLNGRRLVNSATVSTDGTNFVDVNSIPLTAVERIEVLKGGASAIYGSDAVAGVVNIITRKDMDGFEVQLGGQTTDKLDQSEWDVSLIGGAQGEHTRVNLMMSYFKREPLQASDRDFTKNGRNVSLLGRPSAFVRLNQFGGDSAVYTDPTCGDDPLSAPQLDDISPAIFCTFDFNPYLQLMIDEQRFNSYGTLEHDISDHTKAFFEAGYAASRSVRSLSPSFPILLPTIVPIDNPYNTTVNNLRWVGRTRGGEAPPTYQHFQSDTLHTVAGLKGDLGGVAMNTAFEDWEWELAGSFSRNQFSFWMKDTLAEPLQDALECGPDEDPGGCWNPFGEGPQNSQALIDEVTGELRVVSDTELTTVGAGLTGPLFELPGGDLGIAIGAQIRQESARSDLDHDANQLNYIFLIGGPDYQAERRIMAGYAELVIPAAVGLELQAAGRLEDYDDVGSSIDPKVGISWTPAGTFSGAMPGSEPSNVRLRSTFATSFRAPTLLQMNGAQTEIAETFDTRIDPETDELRHANRSVYRAVRTLGNGELGPETSAALTAGVEWKPVRGLTLELDYFRYDFDDLVIKQNHQQLVDEDFRCEVEPDGCDPRIRRDPAGSVQQVDVAFVNAPSVITDGIDLGVNYRTDFGADLGTFVFAGIGTYVLSYDIELEPGGKVVEAAGNRNSANPARPIPQLRANFPLSWFDGGHGAGAVVHFTGGYDNDETISVDQPELATPATFGEDVKPWVTFDLQYSYRLDEGDDMATTFKVGVINVLDSDPPKLDAAYGFDVYVHDPRGRLIYGRLTQEF